MQSGILIYLILSYTLGIIQVRKSAMFSLYVMYSQTLHVQLSSVFMGKLFYVNFFYYAIPS